MGNGRGPSRFRPGPSRVEARALLALVLGVVIVPAGTGCQRLPLRAFEGAPEEKSRTTTKVESGSDAAPEGLPPLPATPLGEVPSQPGGTTPTEEGAPGRATPLLDAALSRASAIESAPVETPTEAVGPRPASEGDPIELPSLGVEPAAPSVTKSTPAAPPPQPEPVPESEPDAKVSEAKPINPDKTVSARPREPWRDGLSALQAVAHVRAGEPGEKAEQWRIRSYLLDRLAETPRDGDPPADWSRVLSALAMADGLETPDPSLLAPGIHDAVEVLEAHVPLTIVDLQFCRKIVAFGSREPLDASSLRAGQPVLVYCEMTGLRYEPADNRFQSRLSASGEIVPAGGGAPVWSESLGNADDFCRQRRRDYYVNYRLEIPANLEPGKYQFRVTQKDIQSGQTAAASLDFTITP